MKRIKESFWYIITEHLEDFYGYYGQLVRITKELPNNYFEVTDLSGNNWMVGEEEIKLATIIKL
jgi:hypothetical protein